ncbi:unnamed protein product [Symbiodinium sp. CCMP2456]|nr:unnamed protein product [Symbiodinium sp. CCMP2456]
MGGGLDPEAVVSAVRKAQNHFHALLLPIEFAAPRAVRRQYLRVALAVHPDKCALAGAVEAFKRASEAFVNLHDARRQEEHLQIAQRQSPSSSTEPASKQEAGVVVGASKFGSGIWGAGFGINLGVWNVVGTGRCTPKDITDAVGTAVQLHHVRVVISLARGASLRSLVPLTCWTKDGGLDGMGAPTLLELPLEVYNDSSLLEDVLRTSAKKAPLIQFWRGSEMLELAFGPQERNNKLLRTLLAHTTCAVGAIGAPNGLRVLREFLEGKLSAGAAPAFGWLHVWAGARCVGDSSEELCFELGQQHHQGYGTSSHSKPLPGAASTSPKTEGMESDALVPCLVPACVSADWHSWVALQAVQEVCRRFPACTALVEFRHGDGGGACGNSSIFHSLTLPSKAGRVTQHKQFLRGLTVSMAIHVTSEEGTALDCGVSAEDFADSVPSACRFWELWRWGSGSWWSLRVSEASLEDAVSHMVGKTFEEFCAIVRSRGGRCTPDASLVWT